MRISFAGSMGATTRATFLQIYTCLLIFACVSTPVYSLFFTNEINCTIACNIPQTQPYNDYWEGGSTVSVNSVTVIGDASFYSSSSLFFIIQIQDAECRFDDDVAYGDVLDYRNTGVYELNSLTSASFDPVTGRTTLAFNKNLKATYSSVGSTSLLGKKSFQVIYVPDCGILNVNGDITSAHIPAWNGKTGGIFVSINSVVNFGTSTIDASGLGFRGAVKFNAVSGGSDFVPYRSAYQPDITLVQEAYKGEGICGSPAIVVGGTSGYPNGDLARGRPGNAGGGGNSHNSGGGGGAGAGGNGASGGLDISDLFTAGFGGTFPSGATSSSRLFFGGGGGGGQNNNDSPTQGYNGGGIIFIAADSITGVGIFKSNGVSGLISPLSIDGGGGGGGGGSVFVISRNSNVFTNVQVSAVGGNGAQLRLDHGIGGGGGGGVVYSTDDLSTSSFIDVSGGISYPPNVPLPGDDGLILHSGFSSFGAPFICKSLPSSSPTISITSTRTRTPTSSTSFSRTETPSGRPSQSKTPTSTPSRSFTSSISKTSTPSATINIIPLTPSRSSTKSSSPLPSGASSNSLSQTISKSPSSSKSPVASNTPVGSISLSGTSSKSTSAVPSNSRTPSISLSFTATPTISKTPTSSTSPTISVTKSPSLSASSSKSLSSSNTPSKTISDSRSATSSTSLSKTPTVTRTISITPTSSTSTSRSPSNSRINFLSIQASPTPSFSNSKSLSISTSNSKFPSPSRTISPSTSDSPSTTSVFTPLSSSSASNSKSATATRTQSKSFSSSHSESKSISITRTISPSPSKSRQNIITDTATISFSRSPTQSPISRTPTASKSAARSSEIPAIVITMSNSATPTRSATITPSSSPSKSQFICTCNDNNICTNDTCHPITGDCLFLPLTSSNTLPLSCDDESICTTNDVCVSGECVGSLIDCNDFNDCTVDGCDISTGNCTFVQITSENSNDIEKILKCNIAPPSIEFLSPSPSPSNILLQYILAPIDFTVTKTPTALPGLVQAISNVDVINNNNNNDDFPGESKNQIVSSSGLGGVASIIGSLLFACACCFGLIFGLAAGNKTKKKKDHLVDVIEAHEDTISSPVESPLFS